ncbi:membrane protein insertion efficiency factor YidD [Chryseobacterium indologenes]|uniref:membrane protein insertion efficiency factor YidD n=1 Tax=Chryseobacterium indologenes TaxID=253 RepID=UPI0016298DA2|nr:membrane protein insertion efficiency factor YidD [Chryseobacterium indologenes]
MKKLITLPIKLYWWTIPPHKRRKCLFKTSCSKHVYIQTTTEGFFSGLKALHYRYYNCRSRAMVIKNPLTGKLQIILPNNHVLNEQEISDRFINQ